MQDRHPKNVFPGRAALDSLAGVQTDIEPVFSLYLTAGSPDSFQRSLEVLVQQPAHQSRLEQASAEYRQQWQQAVETLTGWLADITEQPGLSLAIFYSQAGNLWRVVRLPGAVTDRLIVDTRPFLRPLEILLAETPCSLVAVLASEDDARLYEACFDQINNIQELLAAAPGAESSAGLGTLAARVQHLWQEHAFGALLLGGDPTIRSQIVSALQPGISIDRIAEIDIQPNAAPEEVLDLARKLSSSREEALETQRVEEVTHQLEQGGLAVAGLEQTLLAVRGKKARLVLVEADYHLPGGACPNCGYLGEGVEGVCLVCEMALRPEADIIEAALKQTLDAGHQIDVLRSQKARGALALYGKIAALVIDEGSKPAVKDSGLHVTLAEDGTINPEALHDETIEESFPASDPPGW